MIYAQKRNFIPSICFKHHAILLIICLTSSLYPLAPRSFSFQNHPAHHISSSFSQSCPQTTTARSFYQGLTHIEKTLKEAEEDFALVEDNLYLHNFEQILIFSFLTYTLFTTPFALPLFILHYVIHKLKSHAPQNILFKLYDIIFTAPPLSRGLTVHLPPSQHIKKNTYRKKTENISSLYRFQIHIISIFFLCKLRHFITLITGNFLFSSLL